MATGYIGFSKSDLSQVFDVSSPKSCFSSLQSYPMEIDGAIGGVLNGSPLICGGKKSYETQSSCYMHEKYSNTWKFHANMSSKRKHHSSTLIHDYLWITGGYDGSKSLDSTEFIFSNGSVNNGPNMPAARHGHCLVTLDNGKVMILGGYPSLNYKNLMIFDPEDNTFNTGPSLLFNRVYFGCALFKSPLHNNRPVVLAAGGSEQKTAEILDYTNATTWEQSKHVNSFNIVNFSN